MSAMENKVYSLTSAQQIEKGVKQQKHLLLEASGFYMSLQSHIWEILFEMAVYWSGLEDE